MKKKLLFVLTSHGQLGDTGKPTGYFLGEVSHPWEVLHNAGYEIDFVSPKGGTSPIDGFDLEDPVNKAFWEHKEYRNKIENAIQPEQVEVNDYSGVFYAGGHGTMWDFAENRDLAKIAAEVYENGGVVAGVCHGPSGLVNIKLSSGDYLVNGKKINAFTNEEETAIKLDKVVPFLLESKLKERGAIFEKSAPWQVHVSLDQRIVTGQNPQSAKKVGEVMLSELEKLGN